MSDDTYYSVLGVSETATQLEIKAAYRNLLKQIHPDTVSTLSPDLRRVADDVTKDIIEAYSVLSDASMRRQYDRELGLGEHRLKSVRSPTTPDVPLCPTSNASTSAGANYSQRRQQVHHYGNNRRPSKLADWVFAIFLALVFLADLVLLGAFINEAIDTPSDSDDSKVFSRGSTQSTFLGVTP